MKSINQLNRRMKMQAIAKDILIPLVFIVPTIASMGIYVWLAPVSFYEKLLSVPCMLAGWVAGFLVLNVVLDEVVQ